MASLGNAGVTRRGGVSPRRAQRGRRGIAWCGLVSYRDTRRGRQGAARQGLARSGTAGVARRRLDRHDAEGRNGLTWHHVATRSAAGDAGLVTAGLGVGSIGWARQARRGYAGNVPARHGRRGATGPGIEWSDTAGKARRGLERRDAARTGKAGQATLGQERLRQAARVKAMQA